MSAASLNLDMFHLKIGGSSNFPVYHQCAEGEDRNACADEDALEEDIENAFHGESSESFTAVFQSRCPVSTHRYKFPL